MLCKAGLCGLVAKNGSVGGSCVLRGVWRAKRLARRRASRNMAPCRRPRTRRRLRPLQDGPRLPRSLPAQRELHVSLCRCQQILSLPVPPVTRVARRRSADGTLSRRRAVNRGSWRALEEPVGQKPASVLVFVIKGRHAPPRPKSNASGVLSQAGSLASPSPHAGTPFGAGGTSGLVRSPTCILPRPTIRRFRTFSWATMGAPVLVKKEALPPVWSPCQCVLRTMPTRRMQERRRWAPHWRPTAEVVLKPMPKGRGVPE
jgi:hypothetical protein